MEDIPKPIPYPPTRFMDKLRAVIRAKQLSYKTEQTYCGWVRDYIRFHKLKHPSELGTNDVDEYLSHLSNVRSVSASTQKTALNAIVFMYKQWLNKDVGKLDYVPGSLRKTLPVVFSHSEAMSVINQLSGIHRLGVSLMYGSGLRVMETVRLRIQDIDFANKIIIVRETKGLKWRRTLLPVSLVDYLRNQVDKVAHELGQALLHPGISRGQAPINPLL